MHISVYEHSILLNNIYNKRDYKWLRFTQAKLINMKERDRETICIWQTRLLRYKEQETVFKRL